MDATEVLDAEDSITIADAEAYANALSAKAGEIRKGYQNLLENADILTEAQQTTLKASVITAIETTVSIAAIVTARTGE